MSHWLDTVARILLSSSSDLDELARIAGYTPEILYLGTDLSSLKATEKNATTDDNPALLDEYRITEEAIDDRLMPLVEFIMANCEAAKDKIRLKRPLVALEFLQENDSLIEIINEDDPEIARSAAILSDSISLSAYRSSGQYDLVFRTARKIFNNFESIGKKYKDPLSATFIAVYRAIRVALQRDDAARASILLSDLNSIDFGAVNEFVNIPFEELVFTANYNYYSQIKDHQSALKVAQDFSSSLNGSILQERTLVLLKVKALDAMGTSLFNLHDDARAYEIFIQAIEKLLQSTLKNAEMMIMLDVFDKIIKYYNTESNKEEIKKMLRLSVEAIDKNNSRAFMSKSARKRLGKLEMMLAGRMLEN